MQTIANVIADYRSILLALRGRLPGNLQTGRGNGHYFDVVGRCGGRLAISGDAERGTVATWAQRVLRNHSDCVRRQRMKSLYDMTVYSTENTVARHSLLVIRVKIFALILENVVVYRQISVVWMSPWNSYWATFNITCSHIHRAIRRLCGRMQERHFKTLQTFHALRLFLLLGMALQKLSQRTEISRWLLIMLLEELKNSIMSVCL